jgi:hypothetical protein
MSSVSIVTRTIIEASDVIEVLRDQRLVAAQARDHKCHDCT